MTLKWILAGNIVKYSREKAIEKRTVWITETKNLDWENKVFIVILKKRHGKFKVLPNIIFRLTYNIGSIMSIE